jgi:hypothetical protein
MKIMNWIKNSVLVFLSVVFTLGIAEIFMYIDGRYDSQVSLKISEIKSNKIWSRASNSKETRKHPDLDYDIDIIFDQIGARKSDFVMENKKSIVGVFGDSFTENRRIDNEFSFTEILNSVSKSTHFANFGVDGYGLEQSFQHWIDKRPLIKMDMVFYLFCPNDFDDTFRVLLFNREEMANGNVVNIANTDIPLFIKFVSNFHLTYLFIESYYKLKSIKVSKSVLADHLARRFSGAGKDYRNRTNDPYISSLTNDFLKDPLNPKTAAEAQHFISTLYEWKDQVEISGGEFIVLVLHREIDQALSEKLIPKDIKTINLAEYNNLEFTNKMNWNFNSDGHWNEYGNLTAAMSLNYLLENLRYDQFSGQTIDSVTWDNYFAKIEMLYKEELAN